MDACQGAHRRPNWVLRVGFLQRLGQGNPRLKILKNQQTFSPWGRADRREVENRSQKTGFAAKVFVEFYFANKSQI